MDFENISFSGDENILLEEKEDLSQRYKDLIRRLQKEKETIIREIKKETTSIVNLGTKNFKPGSCYYDDINISFPYELKREEQTVLGIEIPEGAQFCSQECLLDFCKEYKIKEKLRQKEKEKSHKRVENDRKKITEIQGKIGVLVKRINNLERRQGELKLLEKNSQGEERKTLSFFGRI